MAKSDGRGMSRDSPLVGPEHDSSVKLASEGRLVVVLVQELIVLPESRHTSTAVLILSVNSLSEGAS